MSERTAEFVLASASSPLSFSALVRIDEQTGVEFLYCDSSELGGPWNGCYTNNFFLLQVLKPRPRKST